MRSTRERRRGWWLLPVALTVAIGTTGCERPFAGGGGNDAPTTLVVSEAWIQTAPDGADVRDRLAALQRAITQLREETGTGWVGRQDDVTGYLAELSGGSRTGTPRQFMDEYGDDLFGVGSSALSLGEPDTTTLPDVSIVRAEQVIGAVPVLDASLVFASTAGASQERLTAVRGRVFPNLSVDTTPQVGRRAATRIAEEASGGSVQKDPELVVMPTGAGRLAWQLTVVTGADGNGSFGDGLYFVDALTGDILGVRPASAEGRTALPWAQRIAAYHARRTAGTGRLSSAPRTVADPHPDSVEITGENPIGGTLTGHGVQTPEGVELRDTTTPTYDGATGRGGIITYDATGISEGRLPGKLATSPSTTVRDKEALGAHVLSREVYDYYTSLGRRSWDGEGGSLVSSVHFGPPDFCNSFFTSALAQPQMIYGGPCEVGGELQEFTEVEIDTAGHEITHGVTDTSAGLIYSGQSGALNESFSDYMGNVIGNKVSGTDTASVFENSCFGFTSETLICTQNPDGSFSLRYMLNGSTYDDYLRLLDPGIRFQILDQDDQDHGGVHLNSAIWNNALWSIRAQLAKIDNQSGNDSPLAQGFDRAVYGALVTRLGQTSGFIDARTAVEQVIVDLDLDPVVLRVAREVFDANKICPGCSDLGTIVGDTVTASPQTQLYPVVSGDQVAWVDISAGGGLFGFSASTRLGGATPTLGASADVAQVAFAGDALLTLDATGRIERVDADGAEEVLARVPALSAVAAGLASSDAGAAWVSGGSSVSFVNPGGQVTTAPLPDLGGDSIVGLGTGGGTVGLGTDQGRVFHWQPGGAIAQVGKLPGAVLAVAAYGDQVLAIDDAGHAQLFGKDGRAHTLSDNASTFGATMSAEYAVWAERTGPLQTAVEKEGYWSDTDLHLLSLASGKIYNILTERGQQGFPTISGRRLAWQDAAFGGDDVLTTELPPGL